MLKPISREPFGGTAATWSDGRVACVWLPYLPLRVEDLPLRVEVLRHPEWDGRPLVLEGGPGGRRTVGLCSPEAAAAGLHPGLPLREVPVLSPEAVVVQPDPVRVAAVLERVLAGLQRAAPVVESDGERFFLDLRGLRALYGGDLARLERALRGAVPPLLRPRVGVGAGKFAAGVAAREAPPAGLRVVPRDETAAFLRPLPAGYLPLPPDALERLERFGLPTIGSLADLPFGAVQAQFGPAGARAWRLAHGHDDEPVVPARHAQTVEAGLRLDDPLASTDGLLAAVRQLVARVVGEPAFRGRSARGVHLRALLADGTSWEKRVTFKEPLSDREVVFRALKVKLELPDGLPAAAVDELSLALTELGRETGRQGRLFVDQARQLEWVDQVVGQMRARYGEDTLFRAVPVEPWSRIPERRWALVPACEA
jgi:DNA polymerase-4/protein ImuB